jgi:hypothetical protein
MVCWVWWKDPKRGHPVCETQFGSQFSMIMSPPQNNHNDNDYNTQCYEFIYFDTRGAGEYCRLLLTVFGFRWKDIRYPIRLAGGGGWALSDDYVTHQRQGEFVANLDRLPILNILVAADTITTASVTGGQGQTTTTTTTIGQSHAIARYLWQQHLRENHQLQQQLLQFSSDHIYQAHLDCLCEGVRDIQSAWYQAKIMAETKRAWFATDLPRHCEKLEACIVALTTRPMGEPGGAFVIPGTTMPSIADIAIYHLLGTPVSMVTGSVCSLMDNEGDRVVAAYCHLPRLKTIVTSVSNLPSIRRWEETRPDTFS